MSTTTRMEIIDEKWSVAMFLNIYDYYYFYGREACERANKRVVISQVRR